MSKVFVCYSHEDEKYFQLVSKHLSNKKDLDVWSDKRIKGADKWKEEINKALDSCNLAVLILSANFFNSDFIKDIELKQLLENQFMKNTKLLPILAEDCDLEEFSWIVDSQILPSKNLPLENVKNKYKNKEGKNISRRIKELLIEVPETTNSDESNKSYNYPDAIAENNFPTSNDKFFGREQYFNILDEAWDNEQINVISFVAFGGVGKTSLIDNWLKNMKKMHYKGANKIFMWSFYSQGSEEDRQVTATEFLLEACKFFKLKKIPKTSYEQGKELADIISKQRILLILDGLEPLQSSLEDIGEIKDNGLQVLLKRLSRQNKGLLVVTSRIKLASIENEDIELEKLEDKEGAALLKSFELNGTDQELEKISSDFEGHALALKLLGSYTNIVLDKDITRINEIESLRNDQSKTSKHATRMLNSYKKYLQNTPELDILKLLGFFDKAISFEVINIIKNKPLIENISDKLISISEIDWKYALNRLKELHLINNNNQVLDTHPLVREYFSKYISENFKDSYIKGHKRLCKYYESLPEKEYPDTIEEMEPLFQAIYHACKAGKYTEALHLYDKRINRGVVSYIMSVQSRFDIVLNIVSNFFFVPYRKFHINIHKVHQDAILGHLGYSLSALGKSKEALKIINMTIESCLEEKQFNLLIRNVNNIIDIHIALGNLDDAEKYYDSYCQYIPLSNENDLDAIILASYGYIQFLKGNFSKSEKLFLECETKLLKTIEKLEIYTDLSSNEIVKPENIYSFMGYMFYEYLFYTKQFSEIEKRIKNSLAVSKFSKWTLEIGLDYITLGRLKLIAQEKESIVLNIYNKALESFRKSNEVNYIAKGLIARAEALRTYKHFLLAHEDLDEAYDIVIRSELKWLLANWYIVAIQIAYDERNYIKTNTYFLEAKELYKELDSYVIFIEQLNTLESDLIKGDVWTK